jgi:hypothetical protein
MKARFLVEDTFVLASRGIFVVHGKILDGTVRRGQRVRAPRGVDAPIDSVEFLLLSADEGSENSALRFRENPALAFRYRDEVQLAAWQALALKGQTLELGDDEVGP